jgi:hypothetical protein
MNGPSPVGEVRLPALNLQQRDFFFALALLIGVYLPHHLAIIREVGEVEEKVVRDELFAEVTNQVRNPFSVDGVK